jgi:linoleoyl-CoA desaturase
MQRLKFVSNDPRQKQFAIEVRQRVNNYFREKGISTKGDVRMYIKAILMLSMYIIPFVLLLTLPMNIWLALLLVIIMGIGEAGIGMSVMHDGAHGSFSEKEWVNLFFASTMFLLGSNIFNWKVQHNILHHTFTNIYGYDQDIETKAVIRLCDHAPLKKFHRFQYIYAFFFYGLMTLSRLITDFQQLVEYNKAGITKEQHLKPAMEIIKLAVIKLIYLAVIVGLPLLLTAFLWWQVVLGFAIMHIVAGSIMSTVFQMAHVVEGTQQPLPTADGIINAEWAIHELRTTSDFAPNNLLLNWYIGGLNFQIEHHLFRNICHIHYRKIAPIVERTAHEFGFTYNLKPTFIAALASHDRRLRVLGNIKISRVRGNIKELNKFA